MLTVFFDDFLCSGSDSHFNSRRWHWPRNFSCSYEDFWCCQSKWAWHTPSVITHRDVFSPIGVCELLGWTVHVCMGSERPVLNPHNFEQWYSLLSTVDSVSHLIAVSLEDSSATAFVHLWALPRFEASQTCQVTSLPLSAFCRRGAHNWRFKTLYRRFWKIFFLSFWRDIVKCAVLLFQQPSLQCM